MTISVREQLLAVPGWSAFPTVDEIDVRLSTLSATHRDVELQVIGRSRAGTPMTMASVGRGSRHALVIGMPHPNEPTGALAALWLTELMARDRGLCDELGLVWHFIACADPDGTRLNEGWFAGPYTGVTYSTHLYRPPFAEQFEWTFHRDDLDEPGLPSTPESRAVMSVIDSLRPELVVSMHNGEDGGFYTYTSDKGLDLGADMEIISAMTDVPLELGHPEAPGELLGPALFHAPQNLTGGGWLCSTDYAGKYGALGLTTEPPFWVDGRASDSRPVTSSPAASVGAVRNAAREQHERWVAALRERIDLDTVRGRAVLSDGEQLGMAWPASDFSTVAEAASWSRVVDLERRRAAGHVIALLGSRDALDPVLGQVADEATAALSECAAGLGEAEFVGLDRAVACHVGVVLGAAARLARG